MKKFLKLLLVAVASLGIFTACEETKEPTKQPTQQVEATVKSIAVDATTVPAEIKSGQAEAEIAKIKLVVTMSDGTTKNVNVTKDMISAKDLEKLADIGTYKVKITYEGQTAEVTLVVVEEEEVVTLTKIELTAEETEVDVKYGASYNVLEGVRAIGNDGISYLSRLTYVVTNAAGEDVSKTVIDAKGKLNTQIENEVYTIVISIDYEGIKASLTKTVTIGEKPDTSGNLIPNGEFPFVDGNYTGWDYYHDEFGVASLATEVINGKSYAKVVEEVISPNAYGIRLNNNSTNFFNLYEGQAYQISFYAKASTAKTIQCQVGQLINADPWFYNFGGQFFEIELSTELQLYTFEFTAGLYTQNSGDLASSSITFEMGKVSGDETVATIWLGEVSVCEYSGEIADTISPVISASNKTVFVGDFETLDLSEIVSVSDAVDGEITPTYVIKDAEGNVVQSISGAAAGVYTIEINAVDAAGNEAESTIIITVKERTVVTNAFGDIEGIAPGGAADLANNPGKFLYWTDTDPGRGVTSSNVTYVNNVLKFENTVVNANSWGIQGFYTIPAIQDTDNYNLSVKIKSTVAGKISLNIGSVVNKVELVVGDNEILVPAGNLVSGQTYQLTILFGTQNYDDPNLDNEIAIAAGTFEFSDWKLTKEVNYFGEVAGVAKGDAATFATEEGKVIYWMVENVSWNCGPVTSTTVTYENGVVKFVNDQGENTNAWGIQAFYAFPQLDEAGNYVLSLDINSSIAGNITITVGTPGKDQWGNNCVNAIKANVVELVAGANSVVCDFGALEAGVQYEIQIIFGTQTSGEAPIGSGTFEFSNFNLTKGNVEVEEPSNPETPVEQPEFGVISGIQKGEAGDAPKNFGKIVYWTVDSLDWNCGPICTSVVTVENNVLKMVNTQPADSKSWGVQFFYEVTGIKENGNYQMSVNVKSSVAGKITFNVNGIFEVVELVAGDNLIVFDAGALTAGSTYTLNVTFGYQVGEAQYPIGDGSFEFSNFDLKVKEATDNNENSGSESSNVIAIDATQTKVEGAGIHVYFANKPAITVDNITITVNSFESVNHAVHKDTILAGATKVHYIAEQGWFFSTLPVGLPNDDQTMVITVSYVLDGTTYSSTLKFVANAYVVE